MAEEEVETEEEEPEEEEEEEGAEEEEEEVDLKALQAENARMKKALRKARQDSARDGRRESRRDDKDEEPDEDDRVGELQVELWFRDAVEELREAGVTGTKAHIRRVARALDSIRPEELEDAIEDLKADAPQWFKDEKAASN